MPPALPGWRTRAERFDDAVISTLEHLERHLGPELKDVEVAVEEVPPSDPAPWETGAVPLGRYFASDPAAGLPHRIVVYRRPVIARSEDESDVGALVRDVLVEQIAHMLGRDPGDVDPTYRD
ncbi:metallopeptidase family protein [Ruania halotolerans]|nr:metallopeptidase family protein [Ruania halotolerans]UFU08332.1 metallopeptidase family protein [Ruania halotolerans]